MIDVIEIKQRNISIDRKDIIDILNFEKDDIVFLSGSLVEGSLNRLSKGMGNRLSDIDVFIISDDIMKMEKQSVDYDMGYLKTQFKRLHGISIDIEIFPKNIVLDFMSKLTECKFDSNVRTFNMLELPTGFELFKFTSFIHRFLNGIPIYNEENFNKIKMEFNKDNYYRLMKRIAINNVDMDYEDVAGNIESKHLEVAVTVSRNVLLETMKAYIFHKKASIDRDKWISLKLKNLAEYSEEADEIYKKFKKLYFEEKLDNEKSLRINAEKILQFSNEVIAKIGQDGGI